MVSIVVFAVLFTLIFHSNQNQSNNQIDNDNDLYMNLGVYKIVYNIPTPTPTVTPIPTITPRPTKVVSRGTDITQSRSRLDDVNDVTTIDNMRVIDSFVGRVTFYTASECQDISSPTYGVTASGEYVKANYTVAAGRNIPFNTKLKIEGFKPVFVVKDRGGNIGSTDIDVYTDSYSQAQNFNERRMIYILEYGK